jgi:poly-gamma-glutamate synthesis protein (capsule biosynthesis protein)
MRRYPADRPLAPSFDHLLGRRVPRRTLLAGAAGVGVLGVGAVAAGVKLLGGDGDTPPPTDSGTSGGAPDGPTGSGAERGAGQPAAQGVPEGLALVASPRMPLFGVGNSDVDALLTGGVADWRQVGAPISLPVEPFAIDGAADGVAAVDTFEDYEALAAALETRPGGVALVPLDQIDFRVSVLAVEGFDPLRDGGGDGIVRIAVVGDIVPGRNVHYKMEEYGDWSRPFRRIADHLAAYDLTVANLEGNLSDSLPQPADPHSLTFVSNPAMIDGFKLAGIDAVSLANNHTTWNSEDWGEQGLLDTIASLENASMPFFGAGREIEEARRPWTIEVKGKTIAFLGVDGVTGNLDYPEQDRRTGVVGPDWSAGTDSPGTNPYAFEQVTADVTAAAGQADLVIPYLHGGAEYKWLVPDWIVEAARGCVDAGAAVVVTNHPHLIQGMETYKTTPIVYSPGNFVFDQMFSVETRQGLILEIVLDVRGEGVRVVGIRNHGVEIEDFQQPRLMIAEEQASIMDRFWRATDWLASR